MGCIASFLTTIISRLFIEKIDKILAKWLSNNCIYSSKNTPTLSDFGSLTGSSRGRISSKSNYGFRNYQINHAGLKE
jgi:hypothetical protein